MIIYIIYNLFFIYNFQLKINFHDIINILIILHKK